MGTYTLKQLLQITAVHYGNRFEYAERDVVKHITVKKIRQISRHDEPDMPRERIKYEIVSKSYPQYPPYYTKKDKRGRARSYQRTIAHHYDVILEIDRLSLNTTNWKARVGSGKKWEKNPPQNQIKTLSPKTKDSFKRRADVEKTPEKIKKKYKELVDRHKRFAKYLDIGDYNSQVLGLNGDWIFRCDYPYFYHGHRFGRNYYGNVPALKTNSNNIPFAPKHFINALEVLMNAGVIKDD